MKRRRLQFTLRTLILVMLVAPLAGWVAYEWRQSARRADERREALRQRGRVMSFCVRPKAPSSVNDWPNEGQPQQLGDEP